MSGNFRHCFPLSQRLDRHKRGERSEWITPKLVVKRTATVVDCERAGIFPLFNVVSLICSRIVGSPSASRSGESEVLHVAVYVSSPALETAAAILRIVADSGARGG